MIETCLSDEQFTRIARFIEGRFGIRVPPEKKTMIQARLTRRVHELKYPTIDDYVRRILEKPDANDEIHRMTDLVSTHMTSFFRETSHFDLLSERLIPALCATHHFDVRHPLTIWSSACSTGEEVFSLAMVLEEFRTASRRIWPSFEYALIGTDLSLGVLEIARKAVYPEQSIESIPEPLRSRYTMRSLDRHHPTFRMVPELRRRTFFAQLNLMDDRYLIENKIHIVFCRNVLIYFDRQRQESVLRRLCEVMEPEAFLVLGHAESIVSIDIEFEQYAPTVYRKIPARTRSHGAV